MCISAPRSSRDSSLPPTSRRCFKARLHPLSLQRRKAGGGHLCPSPFTARPAVLSPSGAHWSILERMIPSCRSTWPPVLAVPLLPSTGHAMRWRGQRSLLRFGTVELELMDDAGNVLRWSALVALTAAGIRYPLLGIGGCLQFLDVRLFGKDRVIQLEANDTMPLVANP